MKNFEQFHPEYEQWRERRRVALDLYEGGERIEGRARVDFGGAVRWSGERVYLVRHPHETDLQWETRKCRATYRNFAAPIVDLFAAFVNERRPGRGLPEQLRPLEKDADRGGRNAHVFFGDVTRLAAAGGVHFVLVDMEAQAGKTVAEDVAARRRVLPYFTSVAADDVYDWSLDARGLNWAVLHGEGVDARSFGQTPQHYETLTCWTRTGWERWRKDAGLMGGEWKADGKGKHGLGQVPLIPFHFEMQGHMHGLPATDDVLSLILRIFRRDSELDKSLFDRAVPLLVVNGVDEKAWKDFVVASSNALVSSEQGGVNAHYAEPSGSAFTALAESIRRDEESVREIALRMLRPRSGVGESAESRKIDQKQLDTQLASFARVCANAEVRCWQLAARWMGTKEDDITAPYTDSYPVEEAASTVIATLLQLAEHGIISKETVLRSPAVKNVLPREEQ